VSYVDQAGTRFTHPLLDADTAELGAASPHRRFHAYRGQKHFPGLWWAATTRSHVGYESWLERYWLVELDHDPEVVHMLSQPFVLTWPSPNRRGFTERTPTTSHVRSEETLWSSTATVPNGSPVTPP
jgi:hypothetical protein